MAQNNNFDIYVNYIDPESKRLDVEKEKEITAKFSEFLGQQAEYFLENRQVKVGYNFNSHMGAFIRLLDEARYEYIQARSCFDAEKK
jgi:hypothetical protein